MNRPVADVALIGQFLQLLPPDHVAGLLSLWEQGKTEPASLQPALMAALNAVDWRENSEQVGRLINQLLPLETLVPEMYAEWRPVVRDAVAFASSHLSPARLVPKLVDQLLLPPDTPLEKRLSAMIARVPSLQKVGQIVARNPKLDPAFRAELIKLENAIQDIAPAAVQASIIENLGPRLAQYRVKVAGEILAEASVSAVVRFSWLNPANGQRELGVFKVLKPYIPDFFDEDLAILQGLAEYFDLHRARYQLPEIDLSQTFAEIRTLLAREVQLHQEQANLRRAQHQYASLPGVRVPRPITVLCTPTMTAMSDEGGTKITAAFAKGRTQRQHVAEKLVKALIAHPLFLPDESVLMHADPHAGNLFVDEETGDVLLFDWALAQSVTRGERRAMVRLLLGVVLRDADLIVAAVIDLANRDGVCSQDVSDEEVVRAHVDGLLAELAPWRAAGLVEMTRLITELMASGFRFPPFLLIFRKMLFTLEGVLEDTSANVRVDAVVAGYVRRHLMAQLWAGSPEESATFALPLQESDWEEIGARAWTFFPRLWDQVSAGR